MRKDGSQDIDPVKVSSVPLKYNYQRMLHGNYFATLTDDDLITKGMLEQKLSTLVNNTLLEAGEGITIDIDKDKNEVTFSSYPIGTILFGYFDEDNAERLGLIPLWYGSDKKFDANAPTSEDNSTPKYQRLIELFHDNAHGEWDEWGFVYEFSNTFYFEKGRYDEHVWMSYR